jgi:hypothetical protein
MFDRFRCILVVVAALVAAPAVAHAQTVEYEVELQSVEILTDYGYDFGFAGLIGERASEPIHAVLRVETRDAGDTLLGADVRGHGPPEVNTQLMARHWEDPDLQGWGDPRFSTGSAPYTRYIYAGHDGASFSLEHVPVDHAAGENLRVRVALGIATWLHDVEYHGDDLDSFGRDLRDDLISSWKQHVDFQGLDVEEQIDRLLEGRHMDLSHAFVPCWGLLRDDIFDLPLDQMPNGGMITIGPRVFSTPMGLPTQSEQVGYKCPDLQVRYTLRVTRDPELRETPPSGPCTLRPVRLDPTSTSDDTFSYYEHWGDTGSSLVDDVQAEVIKAGYLEQYHVDTSELLPTSVSMDASNPASIPYTANVTEPFLYNHWDQAPMRSGWVTPLSVRCTYFTNLLPSPSNVLDPQAKWDTPSAPDPNLWPPDSGINLAFFPVTSLWIDDHTRLHLYGEYSGNELVAYRVRYVRRDNGGNILTDLMLRPSYLPWL